MTLTRTWLPLCHVRYRSGKTILRIYLWACCGSLYWVAFLSSAICENLYKFLQLGIYLYSYQNTERDGAVLIVIFWLLFIACCVVPLCRGTRLLVYKLKCFIISCNINQIKHSCDMCSSFHSNGRNLRFWQKKVIHTVRLGRLYSILWCIGNKYSKLLTSITIAKAWREKNPF